MTANPALLKLELALRGVALGSGVRDHPDMATWHAAGADPAPVLDLVLAEDVWVSVPIVEADAERAPFELRTAGEAFVVSRGAEPAHEVRIIPPPRFYGQATRAGLPMGRIGRAYGGHLAISPQGDPPLPVADVVETVRAAFAEGAVELVYLLMGPCEGEDAGAEFLEPYVRAIKRHFDTLVAVQLEPPRAVTWVDRTYAMGVDALSYAIELHDPAWWARYAGARAQRIGRERTDAALARAAGIFPSGTVWSDLVVGLEPPESTIAGIDALVGLGVVPVLTLPRPLDPGARRDLPVADLHGVAPIFAHLFHAVRTARINMHWVRDLSFAVTPLEARFFVDEATRSGLGFGQFYRSRLGALAARNLSRLRRRLRVRQVSDSYDSSGL